MKLIERKNESIYDVMPEFYVGCVYPTDGDSFFSCSNIPSDYEAIPVYCEDGMFFAFMTQYEIHRYEEVYEKEGNNMFNVMYYRRGFQVDNGKDNDYATFEEALDEAFSEVKKGICDQFDITKWENEDEGETYYIWEDGVIVFESWKESN